MALEKTLEGPLDCKEIKPVNPKGNQPWIFIGRTDAEAEAPIRWPLMLRADSLEKTLMLGKIEGKRRRRQQRMRWHLRGWMASLIQWTWTWVNSGRWWGTGRPGVLWFMRSQRVGHDWATELNWTRKYPLGFGVKMLDLTHLLFTSSSSPMWKVHNFLKKH